jgi:hypothetical protein
MNSRLIVPACLVALVIAGCGGGGGGDPTTAATAAPKPAADKPGPDMAAVVAVAQQNAGFAGCRKVELGAVIAKQAASDPESIHPLLCDNQQVADYWVWGSDADATAKTKREDRPSFVNGKIVVTTGEALLAKQYDAEKAKSLAAEIKAACACGTVVTP